VTAERLWNADETGLQDYSKIWHQFVEQSIDVHCGASCPSYEVWCPIKI